MLPIFISIVLTLACPSTPPTEDDTGSDTDNGRETEVEEETPTPSGPVIELSDEIELDRNDLLRISTNLGIELSGGVNLVYTIDPVGDGDTVRVQVNYLIPSDAENLGELFNTLAGNVGSFNAILLAEDSVCEIMSGDPLAGEIMREHFELSPTQDIKLTPFRIMGEGSITFDVVIGGDDLAEIEERLGIELDLLVNQGVRLGGMEVQVNYLKPSDGISAGDAIEALTEFKGTDLGLFEIGSVVVEVVTDREDVAESIERLIDLDPPSGKSPAKFRLTMSVIPVADANHHALNTCSNAAIEGGSAEELLEIDPWLKFGSSLPLFLNGGETDLTLEIEHAVNMIDDSVGKVELHRERGINEIRPVEIVLEVETGNVLTDPPEDDDIYLDPTRYWPTESRSIERELENVLDGLGPNPDDREVAEAIHAWVSQALRYGGPYVGTRYGTESVLGQGFGRCWDLSDVYITMARASELPARQVAGWIYGGEGHVWSQVWLEDEDIWLDVDTTVGESGVSSLYIPIWGSVDGEMLFVYSQWPRIERM